MNRTELFDNAKDGEWYFLEDLDGYQAYIQFQSNRDVFFGIDKNSGPNAKWEVNKAIIVLEEDNIQRQDVPQSLKLEIL